MAQERFVGIDVSKAWLDVAGRPGPAPRRVANDPDGIAGLVADLRRLAPALVVLEATGGLELPALEYGLKCSHLFNLLDSSGSIGVTERTAYILRVRQHAVAICQRYAAEEDRIAAEARAKEEEL